MQVRRLTPALALPLLLLLGGCGYVHLGRLPEPTTTVVGDEKLLKENSDLRAEKKILQQELALTRAQGDAMRMTIENRAADGDTSRRLVEKLNETTRELATLRANYAKLQTDRDSAVANVGEVGALRARLGATEDKLAASLRTYTELQDEIRGLKSEVDRTRSENLALVEQVKTATAQNEQAQVAIAQLNTQLLAQKEARARAEQDAETLRTQVAANPNASALAQQRTAAASEAHTLAAEQAQEIVSLRKDLDTYRFKVDSLETERTQLKQKLATTGPSPDLANVQAKLASAQHENDELRATAAQLTANKTELENQLAQLKDAPAAVQAAALRDQLRDAQAAANALTQENSKLKARLAAAPVRVVAAEPTTRLNLDAPNPPAHITPPPAGENNSAPDDTDHAATPKTAGGGNLTRNGSGVSATLVASVPGSRSAAALPQGRVHVVASGDTLSKISILYYGTSARWADILAANRDILGENNNLVIGRTLRIP